MTLRAIWQSVENFVFLFLNEFINRTMSALKMIAEQNFLDWDIGVILYAAFRWWFDLLLMGVAVGLICAPIFAVLVLFFRFFRIEQVHNKIDKRFGYGAGSAIIGILWCVPFLIFYIFYLLFLR